MTELKLPSWACADRHSTKTYPPGSAQGEWIRGDAEDFGIVVLGDGRAQVRARCRRCGTVSGAIPIALWKPWGIGNALTWQHFNRPAVYKPCSVRGCEDLPTEWHHFAPRNTFGPAADLWPMLPLCRAHHVEWHQRMNGYLWNRRSIA